MYEEEFSKRLADLRMQKGVSAREMSLAIGQNSSYINRIENQRAFPSMQGFFYICEYLGITPREFFAEESAYPQKINRALAGLLRLEETQLNTVIAVIEGLK